MSENYCLVCDGHSHQSKDCPNKNPETRLKNKEPKLKFRDLFGIMPDFTGDLSTEEYLSGIRGGLAPNQVHYSSVGKTVGIYLYIDGEKQLFTLEPELREQIAQGIEGESVPPIHPIMGAIDFVAYRSHLANIARGK